MLDASKYRIRGTSTVVQSAENSNRALGSRTISGLTIGRGYCAVADPARCYWCGRQDRLRAPSPSLLRHGRTGSRELSVTVRSALFEPPPFQEDKLRVRYLPGSNDRGPPPPATRKYTLTHNDITGALNLSIGSSYNHKQVQGFYTRILRDEIVAEWSFRGPAALHVYCHVSGDEKWLAPPQLRDFIFRREMRLVLDTFLCADRDYLQSYPHLRRSPVYIHFESDIQVYHVSDYWGILGERQTWRGTGGQSVWSMLWDSFTLDNQASRLQRPRTGRVELPQFEAGVVPFSPGITAAATVAPPVQGQCAPVPMSSDLLMGSTKEQTDSTLRWPHLHSKASILGSSSSHQVLNSKPMRNGSRMSKDRLKPYTRHTAAVTLPTTGSTPDRGQLGIQKLTAGGSAPISMICLPKEDVALEDSPRINGQPVVMKSTGADSITVNTVTEAVLSTRPVRRR